MKATIASIVLRRLPSHLQFMEMPLKTKILEPQNINEATIITILNNGALEHYDNGGLYVTTYPINFWLDLDEKRKLLVIYTYWDVSPDLDELQILRFVNQANTQKIMLQFSYNAKLGRFYGHYTYPYNVGLLPPHVLTLCQKFSSIFEDVLHEGIAEGVLQELPECPDDDGDEADSDSTVH
jgi:hypothetical protein